jgi:hypothetical protein
MLTVTDTIDTAKTMANSVAEAYGLSGGNNIDESTAEIFKLKLIKKFTTNIDWPSMDTMMDEAKAESKAKAADKVKTNTIDEHIQNPQDSQTDIAAEVPEDVSGGSGEDLGGDMGGASPMDIGGF